MKQADRPPPHRWFSRKQLWGERARVLLTASGIAGIILLVRFFGLLQPLEWAALDQFFRLRPLEPTDERILIVEISEADLRAVGQWPLPDRTIAQVLKTLETWKPAAIGLDIYRDLPVEPGHEQFEQVARSLPNLIGIEFMEDGLVPNVPPPPALKDRAGFNNLVVDADGRVRRSLLYWSTPEGVTHEGFALKIAIVYLKRLGIEPEPSPQNSDYLKLGKATFRPFRPHDGGYAKTDDGGYQILANLRGPVGSFETISLSDLLRQQVEPNMVRDRIVLIGSTAPSLQDFHLTSYSGGVLKAAQQMPGVELQAHLLSQILSAALQERTLIKVWPEPLEAVWIFLGALLGASLTWYLRLPQRSILIMLLSSGAIAGVAYLLFLQGWWIPLIPTILALWGSSVTITSYIAHIEVELKRSKEFLNGIINNIPDPIFVKNKAGKNIVLNQAYSQLVGKPLGELLERSDNSLFPAREAQTFAQHDRLAFTSGHANEYEEELTDGDGNQRFIATKRSIHQDAAGNLFLVGVIRDITERKRLEAELKRSAEELARSNAELKLSGDRLRHLANHDMLTGLPNLKHFRERLEESINWVRNTERVLGLLFLDLDGFKSVNDTQGHDVGNLLLQSVAQRLKGCLRGSDIVSRIGGDEFTVILPAIPDAEVAARVADKILATLAKGFLINGVEISITTSVGISLYPKDGETIDVLINNADKAMYLAKQRGKSQYAFAGLPSDEEP